MSPGRWRKAAGSSPGLGQTRNTASREEPVIKLRQRYSESRGCAIDADLARTRMTSSAFVRWRRYQAHGSTRPSASDAIMQSGDGIVGTAIPAAPFPAAVAVGQRYSGRRRDWSSSRLAGAVRPFSEISRMMTGRNWRIFVLKSPEVATGNHSRTKRFEDKLFIQ